MSCGQAAVPKKYIWEENIALLVIYYEFMMQHSIVNYFRRDDTLWEYEEIILLELFPLSVSAHKRKSYFFVVSLCFFFFTQYLPLICNNDGSLLTVLATNNRIANNVIACNVNA